MLCVCSIIGGAPGEPGSPGGAVSGGDIGFGDSGYGGGGGGVSLTSNQDISVITDFTNPSQTKAEAQAALDAANALPDDSFGKAFAKAFSIQAMLGVPPAMAIVTAAGYALYGTFDLSDSQMANAQSLADEGNYPGGSEWNPDDNGNPIGNDGNAIVPEESKPKESLSDIVMNSIKSQTEMSEEEWGLAKPFYEQVFSEENLDNMQGATNQGYSALAQLFNEATTTSPFEQGIEEFGMNWLDIGNKVMSGDYELPLAMQNQKQDEWDILREATSRGGNFISADGVATSTAGAQQVGEFNRSWDEKENTFGLGLLGMSTQGALGAFGSINQHKSNEYSNLFNGTQSLLNPIYGSASGLTSASAGNIQGAGNTAQNLINSQNWMKVNEQEDPDWWETLSEWGSEVGTNWALYEMMQG